MKFTSLQTCKDPTRWDGFFLKMALVCAEQSKDPDTKVGAVIVGPNREIRSTGFNGFPRGIADSDDRLFVRETKLKLIVHAELNAILAAARVGVPLDGCVLYLAATDSTGLVWGGPPCLRCTTHVIQAGITHIVSPPTKLESKWREELEVSRQILCEAQVDHSEIAYF